MNDYEDGHVYSGWIVNIEQTRHYPREVPHYGNNMAAQ